VTGCRAHAPTDNTTGPHVPAIGLVVAGDAAGNDVHSYLAGPSAEKRSEWVAALAAIEAPGPRATVRPAQTGRDRRPAPRHGGDQRHKLTAAVPAWRS
jgi:hypothetical protein